MRELTLNQALNEALREEMIRDPRVFIMGEDVALFGGAFGVTKGLYEQFGNPDPRKSRVRDTPISETAIIGAAVGAAAAGMRPIPELMFCDFFGVVMDELVNQAAKMRFMFGGKAKISMVLRAPLGAGIGAAAQHSQSLEAWCTHVPGLKVVTPSTPYDAKGLLKAAIRDDDPVVFLEHKVLYDTVKGPVPEEDYVVPLGVADVKREGKDVTVVATMAMVHKALKAAQILEKEGISVEVIDPRTLVPLDKATIINSVAKTGRLVVVEEACKRSGFMGEIAAIVAEEAFDYLDAPIRRVASLNTPVPFSPALEQHYLPNEKSIIAAIRSLL